MPLYDKISELLPNIEIHPSSHLCLPKGRLRHQPRCRGRTQLGERDSERISLTKGAFSLTDIDKDLGSLTKSDKNRSIFAKQRVEMNRKGL